MTQVVSSLVPLACFALTLGEPGGLGKGICTSETRGDPWSGRGMTRRRRCATPLRSTERVSRYIPGPYERRGLSDLSKEALHPPGTIKYESGLYQHRSRPKGK